MKSRYILPALVVPLIALGVLAPKVGAAGDAKKGVAIYSQSCAACHGTDGKSGIPGAPDLTAKDGVLKSPDSVLIERITNGYQSKGSLMAMPPKGGNSSLSAQDISDVLAYIRQRFGG